MASVAAVVGTSLLASVGVSAAAVASVAVGPDGRVAVDPAFTGPQVTSVRVLEEGSFLEIAWTSYVDEEAAVAPENITLLNGSTPIPLVRKPASGPTDTVFFDRENRQMAAASGDNMHRLPLDMHVASIAYTGTIDPAKGITVVVAGHAIADGSGAVAEDLTFTGVPRVSYYTQSLTSASGIVVKAGPRVDPYTLTKAAENVEVLLAKPGTGIAAQLVAHGCSLAVFAPLENAYTIPEHRRGYNPEQAPLGGGRGGTPEKCVSSISESNVLRTRTDPDPYKNTLFRDSNILVHEFGHAIHLVGIRSLPDPSLNDELEAVYANAYYSGRWPNTYAISSVQEYFAVLSTIWFNTTVESPNWENGVSSPVNTRDELRVYDPEAYAFFEKVYPSDRLLPAPWDVPSPDRYHSDYTRLPTPPVRVASDASTIDGSRIRIITERPGVDYQVANFACDEDHPERDMCGRRSGGIAPWTFAFSEGSYSIKAPSGGTLTAISDTEVRFLRVAERPGDDAQRWVFLPDLTTSENLFDGVLVNKKTGTALAVDPRAYRGISLLLTDPTSADRWLLEDTASTGRQGAPAYLTPVTVRYASAQGGQAASIASTAQLFRLPSISDVIGSDWSSADATFLGWSLDSKTALAPDWRIPDGLSEVTLTALWQTDGDPDPGTPDPGTPDPGTPAPELPGGDGSVAPDDDALAGTGSEAPWALAALAGLLLLTGAALSRGRRSRPFRG